MIEKLLRQRPIVMTEENQTEIADGVMIERRRLLWLPALAAIFSGTSSAQDTAKKSEPPPLQTGQLEWSEFLKQTTLTATELHRDASPLGQEIYLQWLALMASRLKPATIPATKLGRFEKHEPAIFFGPSHLGKPFFIIEWRMEPGAVLPPHCHPNAGVCTVGIEGEARVRNFQLMGQAPEFSSRKPFRVRETHNEIIAPGRINTLSAVRDNIHTFQAGRSGARGMDISTYHGPEIGFSFLELDGKPADAEQRIFEAVWKPQN